MRFARVKARELDSLLVGEWRTHHPPPACDDKALFGFIPPQHEIQTSRNVILSNTKGIHE